MLSSLVSLTSILGLATAMTWGTAERARVMVRHEGGRTKVEIQGRTANGDIVEVKAILRHLSLETASNLVGSLSLMFLMV